MSDMEKSMVIPIPTVAPVGWEIDDVKLVQEVWDTFVKPDQDAGNVQSGEMRMLMAILRSVAAGCESKDYDAVRVKITPEVVNRAALAFCDAPDSPADACEACRDDSLAALRALR